MRDPVPSLCDTERDDGRYPGRVPSRIAIEASDSIRMRAASALLADYRVDQVGLIGRGAPAAWGNRAIAIEDPVGWDVAIGVSATGVPDVTVGAGGHVSWAGPSGLARALGLRLGGEPRLAGTVAGDPVESGERFGFPSPIGWLGGELADGIHHCPMRGSLAAVMAESGDGRALVVLDDRSFLDGCLLAAGALMAIEGHHGPVWTDAERYLALIEDVGLVLADRAAA